MPLNAYAVSVADYHSQWEPGPHETIVNARSPGKAKYEVWLDISDAWPELPFTRMRVRKLGPPHSSEHFLRNAAYRGLPDVRCGQRVRVGNSMGTIVGHNRSANFDILFDEDAPRWAGMTLNVHPGDCHFDEVAA